MHNAYYIGLVPITNYNKVSNFYADANKPIRSPTIPLNFNISIYSN